MHFLLPTGLTVCSSIRRPAQRRVAGHFNSFVSCDTTVNNTRVTLTAVRVLYSLPVNAIK